MAKAAASLRVNQVLNPMNSPDLAFQEDVRHELERLKEARKNHFAEK